MHGSVTGLAPGLTVDARRIDVSVWVVLGEIDFDMAMGWHWYFVHSGGTWW